MKKNNYTIFLDRDGVINEDSDQYIKEPSEFHFIEKSPEAIAMLCGHGFDVIVITNQSMIGRGWVSLDILDKIFQKMLHGIKAVGGQIKDIFFCPHAPSDNCKCRKPEPGLILNACDTHSIKLDRSLMVGDSAKDIEAGLNAGCAKTILVLTGNGKKAKQSLEKKSIFPDYVAADLHDAACWIVKNAPEF